MAGHKASIEWGSGRDPFRPRAQSAEASLWGKLDLGFEQVYPGCVCGNSGSQGGLCSAAERGSQHAEGPELAWVRPNTHREARAVGRRSAACCKLLPSASSSSTWAKHLQAPGNWVPGVAWSTVGLHRSRSGKWGASGAPKLLANAL